MPTAARGHQTLSAYISSRFDEFSRSQKDVAQYVVDHLDEVAFHTAEELARRASTSSSTVVRFSQALGFEGFPELQEAAREEYRHHHRTTGDANGFNGATPLFSLDQTPFEQAVAADHVNVEETARKVSRSEVEGAIEAISTADRILIAGTDQMAFFASYLRHLLMLLDVRAEIAASAVAGGAVAAWADRRADAGDRPVRRPSAPAGGARDEDRPPPQGPHAGDRRRDALGGLQARRAHALLLAPTHRRSCARTPGCCR